MEERRWRDNRYAVLGSFMIVSILAGVVGSFFTSSSVQEWYPGLEKPWFNPPSWVFGPVWTFLYITMGLAAFLVYEGKGAKRMAALCVFAIQLILNSLWSIAFFGMRSPALGLIVIAPLLASIAYMAYLYRGLDGRSFLLTLPYLAWVSFASLLNYSILALN